MGWVVDVDRRTGPAPAIERTFSIESSAGFSSFIELGILGIDAVARELAAGSRRITPAPPGLHRKRIVALNGFSCSG